MRRDVEMQPPGIALGSHSQVEQPKQEEHRVVEVPRHAASTNSQSPLIISAISGAHSGVRSVLNKSSTSQSRG